jgi:putative transcriptional regulator
MIKFALDRLMFERNRMKDPELQDKNEVNKNTLYAIYNNTCNRMDSSVINRICKALDCKPGDLLIYKEDKN